MLNKSSYVRVQDPFRTNELNDFLIDTALYNEWVLNYG